MADPSPDPKYESAEAIAYAKNVWDETFYRRYLEVIPLLRTMIVEKLAKTGRERTKECKEWDKSVGNRLNEALARQNVIICPKTPSENLWLTLVKDCIEKKELRLRQHIGQLGRLRGYQSAQDLTLTLLHRNESAILGDPLQHTGRRDISAQGSTKS